MGADEQGGTPGARRRPRATAQAANHGTVEFLLRRMSRKQDFLALSNNLLVINRLTADDSNAAGEAPLAKPENLSGRMRMMAIFANELCELAVMPPTGNR